MNFLTHKLASFMLLTSSLVTSAYCMDQIKGITFRRELSTDTTKQINTVADALRSRISKNLDLPNILLFGLPNIDKASVAAELAQRCGLTCQYVSVADLCKDDPSITAKNLEELFKSAKTGTEKIMLILQEAEAFGLDTEAFKLSISTTRQFSALTRAPSSMYILAFITNNHYFLPKELLNKVDTKIYTDTVLVVDGDTDPTENYINTESKSEVDDTDPTKIYVTTSPESEVDDTVEPRGECSLQ